MLVTPLGNAFWIRAVDNCTGNISTEQESSIQNKYGQPWWSNGGKYFSQSVKRLKSWGFNTLGEYSAMISWPGVNSDSMPFILILNSSSKGLSNNTVTQMAGGLIKDIIDGTDPDIYTGWRGNGFPDAFDQMFPAIINSCIKNANVQNQIDITTTPWLVMIITDDRDDLVGFGPATTHPHLGWIAAVTAPYRKNSAKYSVTFSDTVVYTKAALQKYLQLKYKNISSLNISWGSNYTTWGSDGGWPNGKGFLDESGRNSWIGNDYYFLQKANSTVRNDLDSFLIVIADNYFLVSTTAIRTAIPSKLVCGPACMSIESRVSILRSEGRYIDIIDETAPPDSLSSDYYVASIYNITGKPVYDEKFLTSNRDSPLNLYLGNVPNDFKTQEERGAAYSQGINHDLGSCTKDGICPVIGSGLWSWTDSPNEKMNFGLVTNSDNAYDGLEDKSTIGKDEWGYPTGGEPKNYGDMLSTVRNSHQWVYDSLKLSFTTVDVQSPFNTLSLCNKMDFQIYPNPSHDNLFIKFYYNNISIMKINISNCLGITVFERYININYNQLLVLDIKNYPTGLYFYTLYYGDNRKTGKINILR